MKWWDWMPWSSFSECWSLSQLFHSPLSLFCFLPPPPSLKEPIAFSHPSFDIWQMVFLDTLVQKFFSSLFRLPPTKVNSPPKVNSWGGRGASLVQFSAHHPSPVYDMSSRKCGELQGKKEPSNSLSCVICHYFICLGFFLLPVSVDYNEHPTLSSLVWQIQNIIDSFLMASSPGSGFCLSWGKGLSTHSWSTHFTHVYILTVTDTQIMNNFVDI